MCACKSVEPPDHCVSHPPVTVVTVQAGPNGTQEGGDEMADHEPLRISCDGCAGGCDDCLVEFFIAIAERDARVMRLDGEEGGRSRSRSRRPLDPELERALGTIAAAGRSEEHTSELQSHHDI